jgi:DNA polymerase I-like protein with 3'-5' exonuclease and polymerase domains
MNAFPKLAEYFRKQQSYAETHKHVIINNITNRKFYFKGAGGNVKGRSINFPIQGTSADMMKLAGILMMKYILKHNLFGIVKIVNKIHDEYVVELPIEMAPDFLNIIKKAMEYASSVFCPIVKVKCTPVISKVWTH